MRNGDWCANRSAPRHFRPVTNLVRHWISSALTNWCEISFQMFEITLIERPSLPCGQWSPSFCGSACETWRKLEQPIEGRLFLWSAVCTMTLISIYLTKVWTKVYVEIIFMYEVHINKFLKGHTCAFLHITLKYKIKEWRIRKFPL